MADALKAGVRLKPDLYHDASVYFSDICGFADLLSELSPLEIVNLLGKLWITFDDIIARHNVYKVTGCCAAHIKEKNDIANPLPTEDAKDIVSYCFARQC
jgi:class 3 adenylate cyclase